MTDRRVHATYDGMQIVRYNRAGKWYLEPTDSRLRRQQVSIKDAVQSAIWGLNNGGRVHYGLRGGGDFDRAVNRALATAERGQR